MDQHHPRHLDLHIKYDPSNHMGHQLPFIAHRHMAPAPPSRKSNHHIDHPDIHIAQHQRNHLLLHIIYILTIYMSHQLYHIAHYHMTQGHSHHKNHTDTHIAQHRLHIDLYNLVRYTSHLLRLTAQRMIQYQSNQTGKHLGHKNHSILHHH